MLIAATFFVTREIYKPGPALPVPPPKVEYITTTISAPPPVVLPGRIDTVFLPTDDPVIADGSIDSTQKAVVASDSVRLTAERDTIDIKTEYYFPPVNKFRHTVLSYKKTEKIITEYKTIYVEPEVTFWKRFKVGVGAGYAIYQDSNIKVRPALLAGLFYYF